ncbi:MAG: transporter [Gammaproteobacteria bacterium]|nr:MAG: transporter [Gammaproteobacteria bacterium]
MNKIIKLNQLLKNIKPKLSVESYIFCTIKYSDKVGLKNLDPLCTFKEDEGLTLILEKSSALKNGFKSEQVFKKITLQVYSNLADIGLTSVISTCLSDDGISANIVAGFYHDHIFVPSDKADKAFNILNSLSEKS